MNVLDLNPGVRVTNSARLFIPGEKDSIVDQN